MKLKGFIMIFLGCLWLPTYAWAACIKAEAFVNTTDTPCLVVITSDGRTGINLGSNSPESTLHVNGSYLQKDGSQLGGIRMILDGDSTPRAAIVLDYDHSDGVGVGGDYMILSQLSTEGLIKSATSTPLSFGSGDNRHLTITTTGKVGIGNTTPAHNLQITSAANTSIAVESTGVDTVAAISFGHNYGSGVRYPAYIGVKSKGTNTNNNLHFVVANNISPTDENTDVNTRMIIMGSNGRVGIGTTSPSARLHVASAGNEDKLHITGYGDSLGYAISFMPATDVSARPLNFNNAAGTGVGSIQTTGSSTTYNTTSDYRLKENFTPIPNALERVGALNPVAYNFKNDPDVRAEGFVAHEVQSIAPYAVSGKKDALDASGNPIYQQVDYGKLTPLLAAAIQELRAENQALRAEIEALKASK